MQKHQAAPVVVRFRPTRAALLAGLAGLIAVAFGLLAPLSAQAGDHSGNGNGSDKPWICHPVEGKGENGAGWNVINPNAHSSHINEQNGAGKHTRKDGRTDQYASSSKDCPAAPKPTYTHHPKPTHTKTHHPKPTTPSPTTQTSTTTTTSSTMTSSSTTSSTPVTPATSPSTPATTPPETPATNPPTVAPSQPPAEAATHPPAAAPVAAPVAQAPQQAAVVQNVVPKAATDGADLQPQTAGAGLSGLQPALIGAGVLLLLAAGLLSARRTPTS